MSLLGWFGGVIGMRSRTFSLVRLTEPCRKEILLPEVSLRRYVVQRHAAFVGGVNRPAGENARPGQKLQVHLRSVTEPRVGSLAVSRRSADCMAG